MFPADYGSHRGQQFEYWYWSGRVRASDGRQIWFMFFPIYSRAGPGAGAELEYSIGDLRAKTFHEGSAILLPAPEQSPAGIDLHAAGQSISGPPGRERIHLALDGYVLDLTVRQTKPLFETFGNGLNDGVGVFHNYERQRNSAMGVLTVGGRSFRVRGGAIATHGWQSVMTALSWNWDWLMLQLDDGREVMGWQVRRYRGGPVEWASGSIVDRRCHVTKLGLGDFTITPTGTWTRPDGSCTYPLGWIFQTGGQRFRVEPAIRDQELRFRTGDPTGVGLFNPFWEGAATVTGAGHGWANAEMSGYCRG